MRSLYLKFCKLYIADSQNIKFSKKYCKILSLKADYYQGFRFGSDRQTPYRFQL